MEKEGKTNQKTNKELFEENEELLSEIKKEIGSFDLSKLFEDNGRDIIIAFFDKLYRMRKRVSNRYRRSHESALSSGNVKIRETKLLGYRFVYEYIDLTDKFIHSFLIEALYVFKDVEKEGLKEEVNGTVKDILSLFHEILFTSLDDYLEEDRRFIEAEAGTYIVDERILVLLDERERQRGFDLEQEFGLIDGYEPDEKILAIHPLGTNSIYMTFAIVAGCLCEAYCRGNAFLTRYGVFDQIASLILKLKDLLLLINTRIPLMGNGIPAETEYHIIRTYLAPELHLHEMVEEVDREHQKHKQEELEKEGNFDEDGDFEGEEE